MSRPAGDDPCSQPSSGWPAAETAGRRILGMETEYAIIYKPDDPAESTTPSFSIIEEVLFGSILQGRKAARSLGIKGGYFLENGGLVHLEVFLREQGDTPILEVSTPECSNPRDLLIYQRAFDRILTEASDLTRRLLLEKGYHGRIIFGKNNIDSRGAGYGCHENYFIHLRQGWSEKLMVLFSAPFLLVLALPWIVLLAAMLLAVLVSFAIAVALRRALPGFWRWFSRTGSRLLQRVSDDLLGMLRSSYFAVMSVCISPLLLFYSVLLRRTAFRPFMRDLTPFLVTRQLYAGAGLFNPRSGIFELSQRAAMTVSVAGLIMFGRRKTMFDLKRFLYRPFTLLRAWRRLTISMGDSNLSDLPNLLKIGATSLVIEMIESGVEFEDLRLRRPVRAFRQISSGGPWKEIETLGGLRLTALDIQREYLRRAMEFFAGRPEEGGRAEVLRLWGEILEQIADEPGALSGRLDWAAKKSLLDRAILPQGNWKPLAAWAQVFSCLPVETAYGASTLEEALADSGQIARSNIGRAIRRSSLEPEEFARQRDLYFQCRKLDLRFHEISFDGGYQRRLEKDGLIERLTDSESVQRATRTPPPDTRARVRGYYIHLTASPNAIQANWEEVLITGSSRVISLSDPFLSRIPTD